MRQLSDLDDHVLMLEYQESIKRLEGLDPDLPKRMYEIRAKYRDYIGAELVARGLITAASSGAGRSSPVQDPPRSATADARTPINS